MRGVGTVHYDPPMLRFLALGTCFSCIHGHAICALLILSCFIDACTAACNISEGCRDLIQKLLVADPAQRLTIPGIFQHPWFLHDLPQGAITMNDRFVQAKPVGPGFQPLESIEQNLQQATMEVGGDNNH